MGLFGYVYPLVPTTKHACRIALASNIQNHTFKMGSGPCQQCFIIFLEGFKLSSDVTAWLGWLTAQLRHLADQKWL